MSTPEQVQVMNEIQTDIKLGDALARLKKNKDFKLIIQDLFLDGGSISLAKNLVVLKDREKTIEQIAARGYLYRLLMEIEYSAEQALFELQNQANGESDE